VGSRKNINTQKTTDERKLAMPISIGEAIELIRCNIKPLLPVRKPIFDALGQISAEEIISLMDQPPFPRSPYDGYALIAADSLSASLEIPVTLKVTGRSFAGLPAEVTVNRGEAVRIMTGGVIPDGADCVIAQEHTDEGETLVRIYEELRPFSNYCRQGEDFLSGSLLAARGVPVTAAVYSVAASAGFAELSVFPKPRVSVISTGDELQSIGRPLEKGQIYSSNDAYLSGRLSELHIPVAESKNVCDDLRLLTQAFEKANESSDIIISTGGVSVGQRDLIPATLEKLGAKVIFRGVGMKPGMPAVFAVLNGKPILSLSGNPFASAVTFELLVRPALACLSSDKRIEAGCVKAALAEDFPRKSPVTRFCRGSLKNATVSFPGMQGNGQIRTMIGCNVLAAIPPSAETLPAGTIVDVFLMDSEIY
jgi:molybdopterin molybdotransferase